MPAHDFLPATSDFTCCMVSRLVDGVVMDDAPLDDARLAVAGLEAIERIRALPGISAVNVAAFSAKADPAHIS